MIKKIFLCVLILFLCACQEKVEPKKVEQTIQVDERLNGFTVDMSGYKNMSAFDHQFIAIAPSDLLEIKEEKVTGLFFIGFKGCHVCQEAVQYMNEVAKENNIKIYYIDAYSEKYPLSEVYAEVFEYIRPVIDGDGLSTPLVFAVKDGEFKGHHMGLVKDWNYEKNSEKQVQQLKNNYQKLVNNLY